MRKRNKPRVVWLPPDTTFAIGNDNPRSGITRTIIDADSGPGRTTGEITLVADKDLNSTVPASSLSDVENSGYRIRRIVGKCWIFCDQVQDAVPAAWVVTAGIIVRRVDQRGISLAVLAPELVADQEFSPQDAGNWSDPWIWRRSWVFGNFQSTTRGTFPGLSTDNTIQSSVMDGPHIDAKTARLVGPEERLCLDVSVTPVIPGAPGILTGFNVLTDIRVLGSMRTSTGNRRNASR